MRCEVLISSVALSVAASEEVVFSGVEPPAPASAWEARELGRTPRRRRLRGLRAAAQGEAGPGGALRVRGRGRGAAASSSSSSPPPPSSSSSSSSPPPPKGPCRSLRGCCTHSPTRAACLKAAAATETHPRRVSLGLSAPPAAAPAPFQLARSSSLFPTAGCAMALALAALAAVEPACGSRYQQVSNAESRRGPQTPHPGPPSPRPLQATPTRPVASSTPWLGRPHGAWAGRWGHGLGFEAAAGRVVPPRPRAVEKPLPRFLHFPRRACPRVRTRDPQEASTWGHSVFLSSPFDVVGKETNKKRQA